MISRLIARMNADSSLAIAVAAIVGRLPLRTRDRKRPHNLICAFHAISRTRRGAAATFACLSQSTPAAVPPALAEPAKGQVLQPSARCSASNSL
jgi:hypothetical protein